MTEFKKGDRVRVVSDDTFYGKFGVVDYTTGTWGDTVGVFIDGEAEINFYFAKDELILLENPVRRRLTITPVDATTQASFGGLFDGHTEPCDIVADTVTIEGDFEFDVEDIDPNKYVQVRVAGYSRLTYIDPSGTLAVGDRVLVPLGYNNTESVGVVKALGCGNYDGPYKSVVARLAV